MGAVAPPLSPMPDLVSAKVASEPELRELIGDIPRTGITGRSIVEVRQPQLDNIPTPAIASYPSACRNRDAVAWFTLTDPPAIVVGDESRLFEAYRRFLAGLQEEMGRASSRHQCHARLAQHESQRMREIRETLNNRFPSNRKR